MNKELFFIEQAISQTTEIRDDALKMASEASSRLLRLGSERNRILGEIAGRHLYAVPDLTTRIELEPPDGVA